MDVQGLTEEEIAVAKLAGRFFVAFKELPQTRPGAHPEHWQFK